MSALELRDDELAKSRRSGLLRHSNLPRRLPLRFAIRPRTSSRRLKGSARSMAANTPTRRGTHDPTVRRPRNGFMAEPRPPVASRDKVLAAFIEAQYRPVSLPLHIIEEAYQRPCKNGIPVHLVLEAHSKGLVIWGPFRLLDGEPYCVIHGRLITTIKRTES